jgi:hypothetical protein
MTAFGILPTWLLAGWSAVGGQTLSVALVLAVMLGSGFLTVFAARQSRSSAATVFLGASLFRLILCPALVGLGCWISGLPYEAMAVWMIIAYVACLGLEVAWLVKALVRATKRAQGDGEGDGVRGRSPGLPAEDSSSNCTEAERC